MRGLPSDVGPERSDFLMRAWESGAFLEHQEEHLPELAAALPVGPCPAWCGRPDGHPFDYCQTDSLFNRFHVRDCGAGVSVFQHECSDGEWGAPYVDLPDLDLPDVDDIQTPEQARQLAAALMEAADVLAGALASG